MYKLLGSDELLKNLILLARPYLKGRATFCALKAAYKDFLRETQPSTPKCASDEIAVLSDLEKITPFLKVFEPGYKEEDIEPNVDFTERHERVQRALKQMPELDEEIASIFSLVVHTIFFAPLREIKGGSNSTAIGTLWLNPRPHWSDQDVLEIMVHESTHNLIFLDELVHTHYTDYDEVRKEENNAWSPSLLKPRPLDKVLHALTVDAEVLQFREQVMGHPKEEKPLHPRSSVMIERMKKSLSTIVGTHREKILTERSKMLLQKCVETVDTIRG